MNISSNQSDKEIVGECKYKLNGAKWISLSEIITSNSDSLRLKIQMEVVEIFDNENEEISVNDWHKYGFC